MQTLKLTDVHVPHECYSNAEEDMPSPTTTFSHISPGSFSQAGSFTQSNNHQFTTQQSSLENSGREFGAGKSLTHRGFSRPASIVVEHKPSPLIQRVTSQSDEPSVPLNQNGVVSEATSSLRNCEEAIPIASKNRKSGTKHYNVAIISSQCL